MDAFLGDAELLAAVRAATKLGDAGALALVRELFRFLRLAARHRDVRLSPSPAVDAAWHALLLIPVLYYRVCEAAAGAGAAASSSSSSSAGAGAAPPRSGADVLVPHSPAGAADPDAVRRARYDATRALYASEYLEEPPEAQWPTDYALPAGAAVAAARRSGGGGGAKLKRSAALALAAVAAAGGGGGGGDENAAAASAPAPKRRAAGGDDTFTVNVENQHRAVFAKLAVSADMTVEGLKVAFEAARAIPVDQQRMIYAGQPLEDGRTLGSYGVAAGATLHMELRMRGC